MTQEIIELIDLELERSGKEYMGVAKANRLIEEAGLNTTNNPKFIQTLIKEGKIPHAFKFPQSPQWSIPLSKVGKKRQEAVKQEKLKKENQRKTRQALRNQHQFTTICPRCRTNLVVPHEIVSQYFIQCLNCNKNFKNPFVKQKTKPLNEKNKEVSLSTIIMVSVIVLITVFIVVQSFKDDGPRRSNNQNWDDPGMYDSGSTEWPYHGRTTKEMLIDLRNNYEGRAVTPSSEQSLYNTIGGMYPGSQKGPQYYSYDFLEVPISMTLINRGGQRYYLMFERGGVKKGDPRLKL